MSGEHGRVLPRAAPFVLLAASAVQLLVASLGPLDGDESLYWEWARHLAWGYYDHPPGVALLIRLGVTIFGDTALGVRCVAILANLGGALIVATLARRHGGDKAAVRAALIVSCIPLLSNWLMFATPDTALYLTSMGVLLLVDNALREPADSRRSLQWWLLAGVMLGLAALAKELAILLPAAILVAFLTHRALRPRLATAGPWLACAIAAAMIIPLVLWNRDHDWVLLQFVLHRGLGVEPGSAFGREMEMIGGQVALVSPFLFALLAVAAYRTLRYDREPRRHMLAIVAVVTFGWFAIAALRHQVEPNWLMMAYPSAAILLASAPSHRVQRRWLNVSLALGGAIVLLIYLHTAFRTLPIAPLTDPIRRGHGWAEVAARVDSARSAVGARATRVAANRFQDASQLAFHLAGNPFVYSLNIESRANQYEFWPGFADQAKPGDGLIVVLDDSVESRVAERLAPYFTVASAGERIVAGGAQAVLVPKRVWIFEGWRGGWPAP